MRSVFMAACLLAFMPQLTKAECLSEWIPLQALVEAENAAVSEEATEAEEIPAEERSMHLWSTCRVTHYCGCSQCCGQWAGGATASGAMPQPNHTVAADLPFGTRLLIRGQEYVVEDRGVTGNWVDIFCASHQEALDRGLYYTDVYIVD